MLAPAALNVADRLITALMILVHAVADIAMAATRTPAIPGHGAETLYVRLSNLIATLIRISNFGIRAPHEPKPATPARRPPAPAAPPARSPSLPRRPGWLLAALPDIAPAIAADLGLILADPAFAALLEAAPSLQRTLRPLLRALGLTATPSPNPSPPPARPTATPHAPADPASPPSKAQPPTPTCRPETASLDQSLSTPNLFR